ncbi:guanine nucleotide-binding protein subunit gamma 2 isoform X2 [Solanum dulcamara]|uniref:guanine nucleotide-binding protein subunit gamma 2 isoform X2 n=1 Tax=Solanum dulcamara TaxID=45834 RepID=UPI002485F804|nr:guanine nucleotide-binding protein subunit gamma 2 isoform X2 [Solanum dulcamara]
MQSESSEQVRSVVAAADTRGKHRISAELKRLEQETRFLEEELELLDKMEKASAACKEWWAGTDRADAEPPFCSMTCTKALGC